jgi:hypothetical protein
MKALASRYRGMLFLICAGPISEVFIDTLYTENPFNTYIDAGSSLDVIMKGVVTRDYQNRQGDVSINSVIDIPRL